MYLLLFGIVLLSTKILIKLTRFAMDEVSSFIPTMERRCTVVFTAQPAAIHLRYSARSQEIVESISKDIQEYIS
jgi:hypothetical protein